MNKESIELVKKMVEAGDLSQEIAEKYIPELKESEDERIRKEIVSAINIYCSEYHRGTKIRNDMLDWLERLGEYEKGLLQELDDKLNNTLENETPESLKKFLNEQKPADKVEPKGMNIVEEDMTPFQKKVFCIIDTAIEEEQGLKQVCDELLRLAHDEIMQPAWSEEDKEMSRLIGNAITANDASMYLENKGIPIIDAHVWLDELKDRVQPQNGWKPSDEQIYWLKWAVNRMPDTEKANEAEAVLEDLLEQLKKLMEE